jgi:hypothetical protein
MKIKQTGVNNMNSNFPKCEVCGKDLNNGLDMGTGICGKCWFDSKKAWDEEEEE